MSCPSDETWLLAELGEITVNTRDVMLAHEQDCAICRAARARQQQLLGDLAAPPALARSEDDFVRDVVARCAATPSPRVSGPRTWTHALPWAGGILAVAAALALAWMPSDDGSIDGQLHARGGKDPGSLQAGAVAADVFLARGKTLHRLAEATLSTGDRLAVRVVNRTESARFFMVFAIDSAGDVHWLFPEYRDAVDNPEAPALTAHEAAHVLPETVELEEPAEGALRVVSMLSDRRMNVKEVESRLLALPKAALARVFPESNLREWSCTWRRR